MLYLILVYANMALEGHSACAGACGRWRAARGQEGAAQQRPPGDPEPRAGVGRRRWGLGRPCHLGRLCRQQARPFAAMLCACLLWLLRSLPPLCLPPGHLGCAVCSLGQLCAPAVHARWTSLLIPLPSVKPCKCAGGPLGRSHRCLVSPHRSWSPRKMAPRQLARAPLPKQLAPRQAPPARPLPSRLQHLRKARLSRLGKCQASPMRL